MTRSLRNAGLVLTPILAVAWYGDAWAYRPFDGTDAAIAEPGQVEIELGPAQYLQTGPERMLVAPTIVFNYGLSERWEVVLQGEAVHSLMEGASGIDGTPEDDPRRVVRSPKAPVRETETPN
jgi:hypothetical protein